MQKRAILIIILLLIVFSFQKFTGFMVYSPDKNVTIPETFIQNLDVKNAKFYDENNNGLVDKVQLANKFDNIKIKSDNKERVILSFKDKTSNILELSQNDIEKLLKNPNINQISLDYKFNLSLQDSVPLIKANYVHNIQLTNNITGSNSVCIIDSGIYSEHPAFIGKILNEHCYVDNDFLGDKIGYCYNNTEEYSDANDDIGHGTLIAGIVGGTNVIKGVAPDVKFVVVKVCNYFGQCYYSDLIKGINYCVSNKDKYNISVITLSLGTGYVYSDQESCKLDNVEITNALENAFNSGIFVDVSSGNSHSSSGISAPACLPSVTSVGATDKSDNIAYYSNIGNILDLLAPGSNINTTSCVSGGSLCNPSGFTNAYSGTSFASPHVAGAAVLLMQYAKEKYNIILTPNEIKDILKFSGKKINNYSRIDVLNAVNYLDVYFNDSLDSWIDLNKNKGFYYFKTYLENITFYANFTSLKNSSCILNFENNSYNMNFNINKSIFEFSYNINEFKDYNYSVNCNDLNYSGIINKNDFNFYLNHSFKIFVKNLEDKSLSEVNLVIIDSNESILYNKTASDLEILNITEFLVLNGDFLNKTPHKIIVSYNNIYEERNLTINQSFLDETSDNLFLFNVSIETPVVSTPSSSGGSGGGGGGSSITKETKVPEKVIENAKTEARAILENGRKALEAQKIKTIEEAKKDIVSIAMLAAEKLMKDETRLKDL